MPAMTVSVGSRTCQYRKQNAKDGTDLEVTYRLGALWKIAEFLLHAREEVVLQQLA